ncbi:glycosyltransferase family 4 protein [Fulvivirga sp.]|uniref:glycosyltransferase family 4 protein n=1 Tax=Fulvivirga sp. TaxID=1931237 RepID=UPI0032EFD9C9
MPNKEKGLFLIHLPPPVHGVSAINQWIVDSEKINHAIDIDCVNLATARSIKDIGKQGFTKYLTLVKIYLKTLSKLLSGRYDFMYITLSPLGSAFIKDSILVLIAKLFSTPVFIHLHGKGIAPTLNGSSKVVEKYYNYVFKTCHVIHLADSLVADLIQIKSYKRISILNNGIPIFELAKKTKSSKVRILHLSNLIEAKGSFTILEATNELIKQGVQNFQIDFVGNWDSKSYEDKFRNHVKSHSLEKHVNISGPLYGHNKQTKLSESDLFILPTYYPNECFPLTIIEAFQAGLPVISTYEGAIPEIIQDGANGFLVESKNPFELAAKMKLLIESEPLRKEMSQKAIQAYHTKYTFSIFEDNFLSIIKKATS